MTGEPDGRGTAPSTRRIRQLREARRSEDGVKLDVPEPQVRRVMLDIPVATVIKVLAVLSAVYLVTQIWQLITLLLVSAMLAAALAPYQALLEHRGLPRGLALVAVVASVVIGLGAVGALVVPPLATQTRALLLHSDDHIRALQTLLVERGIKVDLIQIWHSLPKQLGNFNLALIDLFRSVFDSIVALMTVLFATLYMLSDQERIRNFFVFMFPIERRGDILAILEELRRQVGGYVRGELITSLLAAFFAFIVLTVAGVPNAIALAVFVGVADLVPMFGQTLGTIPAVLIALTISPLRALIVLVGFVLYQQVENHYLVPRVYANTMNVSPLVALVGLLIGAKLLGLLGMLLALPFIASLPVILGFAGIHIYVERTGRPPEEVGPPRPVSTPTRSDQP